MNVCPFSIARLIADDFGKAFGACVCFTSHSVVNRNRSGEDTFPVSTRIDTVEMRNGDASE